MNDKEFKIDSYFKARSIKLETYDSYCLPLYISKNLPENKNASILDIGCGLGQTLNQLKLIGFNNLFGIDISHESVEACNKLNLCVELIDDVISYSKKANTKFDFIIMSHVLEHIEKSKIIDTLYAIKSQLLSPNGVFLLMVPNAQSNTGSYWMYEDFTHHTLFTAGSLNYVLMASGFTKIEFVDPYCLLGSTKLGKFVKLGLIKVFEFRNNFWNKVTSSFYHNPSPKIYSFEIKVKAS